MIKENEHLYRYNVAKTIPYTLHNNGRGELPDHPPEQPRTTPPQPEYSPMRTKREKEERDRRRLTKKKSVKKPWLGAASRHRHNDPTWKWRTMTGRGGMHDRCPWPRRPRPGSWSVYRMALSGNKTIVNFTNFIN